MFSQSLPEASWLHSQNRFLILGGGSSGDSAATLLSSFGKITVLADRNEPKEKKPFYSSYVNETIWNPIDYPVDCIIKSPGISPEHPVLFQAKKKGIPILSEISLGRIFFQGKLVGITGTDGKSTTTALTHHILKSKFTSVALGGNIGIPFTSFCLNKQDWAVLELSSYQLDDSPNLKLNVSAILNLAADHLERHKTMEAYALAKWRIQNLENPNHKLFVSPKFLEYLPLCPSEPNLYKIGENESYRISVDQNSIITPFGTYPTKIYQLPGKHNLWNLCFAIAIAEFCGLEPKEIQKSYEGFLGLPHRFQTLDIQKLQAKYRFVRFINDSKSTNLHSLLSGISGFNKGTNLYLLLGGAPKEEPIQSLLERLKELGCKISVYGEASKKWKSEFVKANIPAFFCSNVEEQMNWVNENLKKQSEKDQGSTTVLFSPGCASFDLYKNFEERGNHFVSIVYSLFGQSET